MERHLSEKETAENIGIERDVYVRLESGGIDLNFDKFVRIAKFFRCSLEDLLDESKEIRNHPPYDEVDEEVTEIRNDTGIITKFNIGDVVWLMENNKPISAKVNSIVINIVSRGSVHSVIYLVRDKRMTESYMYASKEELLKSF